MNHVMDKALFRKQELQESVQESWNQTMQDWQRFQNHVEENSELRTITVWSCEDALMASLRPCIVTVHVSPEVSFYTTPNSFRARYRYLPDPVKLNEKYLSVLAISVCMDILYDNKCCNLRWPPSLAFPWSPTPSGWCSKTENEDKPSSSPKLAGSCGHCNWPATRHIKSKGSTVNIINIPLTYFHSSGRRRWEDKVVTRED